MYLIIDAVIPSDYDIQKKATEKITKYVDLQIKCQRLWDKAIEVVPIIIEVARVIERNLKKYLNGIPGCHNVYNLQKWAILGTAHILRKVPSIKSD